MKASHLVLGTQFKIKLKQIMQKYPVQSVHFNEFVEILRKHCIKFYSKDDIIKINKVFDNKSKAARFDFALNYLELVCVQATQNMKFFVVKVCSKPMKYQIKKLDVSSEHQVKKCFSTFQRIMYKLYGSQINWFKVLGGITIAVKIEKNVFQKNISKILHNTHHSHCSQKLTKLFLKNSEQYEIQWAYFMEIVKNNKKYRSFSLTKQSFRVEEVVNYSKLKTQGFENNQSGLIPFYSKSKTKQKKFSFHIDSKACRLYQKKQSLSQTIRPKTESMKPQCRRVDYRRSSRLNKTTSHFQNVQKSEQSSQIAEWNNKMNFYSKLKTSF